MLLRVQVGQELPRWHQQQMLHPYSHHSICCKVALMAAVIAAHAAAHAGWAGGAKVAPGDAAPAAPAMVGSPVGQKQQQQQQQQPRQAAGLKADSVIAGAIPGSIQE
jgi:hypothetical protein